MKRRRIKVIYESQVEIEAEVIAFFTMKHNNRNYIIYTQNKEDTKGNTEVYVSKVVKYQDDICYVTGIEDEKDWEELNKVIADISKDD